MTTLRSRSSTLRRGACSRAFMSANCTVRLALVAGSLWVANSLDSTISRIKPATAGVTATIAVGSGPTALAGGAGSIWVANQPSGTVSRIDPRRDQVSASVSVGGTPTSLTVSGGRVWVGVAASPGSHRGGTLVIVTTTKFSTASNEIPSFIDPALYDNAASPQFMGLAYDSLVTFQQTPGTAGLRLVPDLALSIPAASDGGKTYTFRIPSLDSGLNTASRCAQATFVVRSSGCSPSVRQECLRSRTSSTYGRCPSNPGPLPRDRHRRSDRDRDVPPHRARLRFPL